MKKINIFLIIISIISVIYIYYPFKLSEPSNITSNNDTLPRFNNNNISIRGNIRVNILITNENNSSITFKTSDSSKIKIIKSTNKYLEIERIKAFKDEERIELILDNIVCDVLKITCFNEIIKINNISIYEPDTDTDISKIDSYKYKEGYYYIVFDLEKLIKEKDYELDTLLELEEFLKNNLSTKLKRVLKGKIIYNFYLDYEYFFSISSYKTLYFNFDNSNYLLTLEKAK